MSNTPWERAPVQYAGWVPNALGHLSFSLIGHGTYPKAYAAARSAGAHGQHVIAYHTRVVGDYFLPNWAMRWFRLGSVHDWLLVASTASGSYPSSRSVPATTVFHDDRGMLRGKIFFLAQLNRRGSTRGQRWKVWALRRRFRKHARRITKETIRTERAPSRADRFNRRMLAMVRSLRAQGAPIKEIEFALLRTGEARFWLTGEQRFMSDRDRDVVIKSAYLFLKDVSHRHAHHHHSQDSMLPIVRIVPGGEIEWQRQTIWALSRTIEDNIRRCRRKTFRAALGMIPFAENFHALYSSLVRDAAAPDGFAPAANLDHYSYEALRKSVAIQLETRSWWLAGATAAVASFFAITISSIIAIRSLDASGKVAWPTEAVTLAQSQPFVTITTIWLLLWIVYETIYREAMAETSPFVLVRFVRRFALATAVSLYRWAGMPRWVAPLLEFVAQAAGFWVALSALRRLLQGSFFP